MGLQRNTPLSSNLASQVANASGVANITDCKGDLGKDLAAINKACCVHSGMCDTQHPVPTSCTESCGIIFGSWFSQCGKTALMGQRTAMAMMSKFEAVCRSEGTTCSSALSCAQLANKSVVNDTAGGRWPGADGIILLAIVFLCGYGS